MQNPLIKHKKFIVILMLLSLIVNLFPMIKEVKAQSATIEINSTMLTNQSIGYYGNGFLLTLLPQSAPKNLINEIRPKLFRSQNPWIFQDGSYQSIVSNGGEVQYLVYETFFTANYSSGLWPGDNGDWSVWENSVRTAVQQVLNAGLKVEYEIWNEPDYGVFWQRDNARFFETWKRAYNIIREMAPGASIAGPSLANFSIGYFSDFYNYAKANNVQPDTVVWHELDRNLKYTQVQNHINEFKNWAKSNGVSYKRIVINEIVADWDQFRPGTLVNFFGVLEWNQILGAHSCWDDAKSGGSSNCWNKTLNGTVSANYKPRSTWWVYKYYSELNGKLVNFKSNSTIGGLATRNNNSREVKLLLGVDSNGSALNINYKSLWNSSNIKLDVHTYKLSNVSGDESEPEIKSKTIEYNPNGTLIQLDNLDPYQAVYIKIIEVDKDGNAVSQNKSATSEGECTTNQIFKDNKCIPAVCKTDLNSDGKLDLIDFGNFITKFNSEVSCEFDVIKEGEFCALNLLDLAEFARYYEVENACT